MTVSGHFQLTKLLLVYVRNTELLLEREVFKCMQVHYLNSLCQDMEYLLLLLCCKAELQMHKVLQILILEEQD